MSRAESYFIYLSAIYKPKQPRQIKYANIYVMPHHSKNRWVCSIYKLIVSGGWLTDYEREQLWVAYVHTRYYPDFRPLNPHEDMPTYIMWSLRQLPTNLLVGYDKKCAISKVRKLTNSILPLYSQMSDDQIMYQLSQNKLGIIGLINIASLRGL